MPRIAHDLSELKDSGGTLVAQTGTNFDARGRDYQNLIYSVVSGVAGIALTGNKWYDPSSNVVQQIGAGDGQVFKKTAYNGVNWVTNTYTGFNTTGTSYDQAQTVAGDIIVEQADNTLDRVGSTISVASHMRLNDASATATGALGFNSGSYPASVAAYPFAEGSGTTTADASGNGNNATLSGGVTWGTGGPTGHSLGFDGTGLVSAPDAADLELTGDLTLAAWINPTDFATYRGILSKTNSSLPAPYDLYLQSGTGYPSLVLGDGTSYQIFTASTAPATGVWSHLAVTVSGTAVALYLNGTRIGGGVITTTRGDTGQPLRIGLRADSATAWLGSMSDVRLYDYALSAAEVDALYLLSPAARVMYRATWFDGIDRPIANGSYGAASTFTRPDIPPASSATVLVDQTAYNSAGLGYQLTDAAGTINQTTFNNANQPTQTVEDAGVGGLARTTNFAWTLDGQKLTMTAVNSATGDQLTTWGYGTTLSTSGVARNDFVSSITYPDGGVVYLTCNRQAEKLTIMDQRGTVRTFTRDPLGRQTNDCVTTNGTGTDTAVKQLATAYEVRGMVSTITSTDSATPGSGTILNQIQLTYGGFGELTLEEQSHSGAVVSGTTPSVGYAHDDGSNNQIRLNQLRYPNGRTIGYNFGTSGGMDDLLNRVESIQDTTGTTVDLAAYTYVGLGLVVRITSTEPGIWLDLWGGVSGVFAGLDLFNRVVDQRWQNDIGGTPTDIDRYKYAYDLVSNRTWKQNVVGTPLTSGLDEYYLYDNLKRLTDMQRGVLNGSFTGINSPPVLEQNWSLDPTGNWATFTTSAGGSVAMTQPRTSSMANEILTIGSVSPPATPPTAWIAPLYDAAGNMTTMPQPGTPTSAFNALYDAWKRMTWVGSGGSPVGQYQYDGRHRRIVAVTSETRHFYFTNNWQDIEQRVGTATTMDQQHVWGIRYIDELVCRDDATPLRLYTCQDANFNLTSICDASGTVKERFVYEPYGVRNVFSGSWAAISASAYSWVVSYQSLPMDIESDLVCVRNRYLQPALGIFAARDLWVIQSVPSLYEFEHSNPTRWADPTGLDTELAVEALKLTGKADIAEEVVLLGPEDPLADAAAGVTTVVGLVAAGVCLLIPGDGGKKGPPPPPPPPPPPKRCNPCAPPVGTIMQRVDTVPPSRTHYPYTGTHTHLYVVNQTPYPACKCFVNNNRPADMDGVGPYPPVNFTVTGGGPAN